MSTSQTLTEWTGAAASLTDRGFALLPALLSQSECADLIAMYESPGLFRGRIDMARFRFGKGEYQYFDYPLPPIVQDLREHLYPHLAPIANHWAEQLRTSPFPSTLDELHELCRRHGQTKPTPLILRYTAGDFNCLHQDIYGDVAFPLQVVVFLSQPDRDYTGGEFMLMEQHPRAQSVGRVLRPNQGDAVVITTRYRPAQGKRGPYRVGVRHGVSEVTEGRRWTLGIVFHDAK